MSGPAWHEDATVIALRRLAQVTRQKVRDIGAGFPGWYVWQDSRSGTWNAYREDEEPYFGPPGVSGRVFMVSAYDAAALVALLERQVWVDIGMEFPGWRVGRAASGGWYAAGGGETDNARGAVARLVRDPAVTGLHSILRAQAHMSVLPA